MVQTATEMIKLDDEMLALFYGSDGKTARILVMAGKKAVEKGFDAGEIVKQISPLIGGGGGGRRDFAQGGGTKPEKLHEAIKAAEEAIKKQLQRWKVT
jgi:alanyl-tRNA synthetase